MANPIIPVKSNFKGSWIYNNKGPIQSYMKNLHSHVKGYSLIVLCFIFVSHLVKLSVSFSPFEMCIAASIAFFVWW